MIDKMGSIVVDRDLWKKKLSEFAGGGQIFHGRGVGRARRAVVGEAEARVLEATEDGVWYVAGI